MQKIETKFRIVVLNQTDIFPEGLVKQAGGAIFGAYLYDALRPTHCCEIMPSFELWPLYLTPYQDDEVGSVNEKLTELMREIDIRYVHCQAIERMPDANFADVNFDESALEDLDWLEIREKVEEDCKANVRIDIPLGFTPHGKTNSLLLN